MAKKYSALVVDTLMALQNREYMGLLDKQTGLTRDTWRDFGVAIFAFIDELKLLGCELVLVLGEEGTGKSYGIKSLDPNATVWCHADNKPIAFKGGREMYSAEKKNLFIPKNYDEIEKLAKTMVANKLYDDQPLVVFLLAHVAVYEGSDKKVRERLKVLGNMATKMNIEGSVVHCYYTYVTMVNNFPKYQLRTQNTGYNTGRSPEEMHKTLYIDNNFQIILDAIHKY